MKTTTRPALLRQDAIVWTPQLQEQNQQPPEDDDEIDLTDGVGDDQDGGGGNDDGDDQDGDGAGDDGSGNDDDEDDGNEAPAWVAGFEQRINSEIDRRINSALNKQNRRQGTGNQPRQQDRQGSRQEQRPAVNDTAERDARMVLRETLGDGFTFISPEERKFAVEYGRDKIAAAVARGDNDPDALGERVAGEVRAAVEAQRKLYSSRTKAVLRKKGLLVEQKQQPSTTPGQGVGDTKKGANKAHEMRQKITPGYKAPGQQ